jgi:hypothetical protein
VFAQIESKCRDEAVNIFWSVTLGIPRFLVTPPGLAISRYKEVLSSASNRRWLVDANLWALYSIPVLLLIWAGIAYWWKRHQGAAVVLLTLIVGQILLLGFAK